MARQDVPGAREPGTTTPHEDAASWLDEHGDALFRYARLRVGRRELAEDLVQDTFVAALQARSRYEGGSSVRTWLLSILKHKIVDHHRRTSAARPATAEGTDAFLSSFFGPDGVWKRALASWRTPDEALERREFWEVFDGCLGRLPRALGSVFFLRELEGLGMEQLRERLEISEGNIRVRLHRARLLLRECLERRWFAATVEPTEDHA
jgi:RNA polymerase sigma-70 factor (ECF subfamily)